MPTVVDRGALVVTTIAPATTTTTAPERLERNIRLQSAIVEVDGDVRVQVQSWASMGCGRLVGRVDGVGTGTVVAEVEGMAYPENVACTADMRIEWLDMGPIPDTATVTVIVRHNGREARHTVTRSGSDVTTSPHGDASAAPFAAAEWWRVPDDILFSGISALNDDGTHQRVTSRVEDALAASGFVRFDIPPGREIPPRTTGSIPVPWSGEYGSLYRGPASDGELQAIAEAALDGETCAYIVFERKRNGRRHEAAHATAPCSSW